MSISNVLGRVGLIIRVYFGMRSLSQALGLGGGEVPLAESSWIGAHIVS